MIEILLGLVIGILAGIITGLIPGVHINLISVLLISISGMLLRYTSPLVLCVFIISMSITHTFLDSIPSIFLGAPDSDQVMAVLPGHKLLLEGKGFEAVKLTTIGSLLCLLAGLCLVPLLIYVVPWIYEMIKNYVGYILIGFVGFMLLRERKIWGIIVFLISGILGWIVLNFPNLDNALFPMLSGLFGVSGLLLSLGENELPFQDITNDIVLKGKDYFSSISGATISGWLTSMFPGLGSAQAAVLCGVFLKIESYSYLVLVGGINTVNFLLSLVTLYTLGKARNGAVIAVTQIIEKISLNETLLFFVIALIVGGVATLLALILARGFSFFVENVNYNYLCYGIIGLIIVMTFVLSGWIGGIILGVSTALGMIAPIKNVGRNNAMGCLLIPVIIFLI